MLKFALFCEHCLSLLFIHCICMLMEERSIHILIFYKSRTLFRVNSLTFVTDDCLCRVADIYDMMGWINWCSKWMDDRGIQISRILLLLVVDRTWKALQNYWTRTYPSWNIHGGKKHWLSHVQAGIVGPLFPFFLMNNSWLFLLLCLIHGLLYLSSLQSLNFCSINIIILFKFKKICT